jgi:hypothetical protein
VTDAERAAQLEERTRTLLRLLVQVTMWARLPPLIDEAIRAELKRGV